MRGTHSAPSLILSGAIPLVKRFKLKSLFRLDELNGMMQTFGLNRMSVESMEAALQLAFTDYVVVSLAEQGGHANEHRRLYIEAEFHLSKAQKLLEGLPHPAGKMSYRLYSMTSTLHKLIEGGDDFSAERATRFVEKNLVRRLRDIWTSNTSAPFSPGSDALGKGPRDFLLCCFTAAAKQYPELVWFQSVNEEIADQLIQSIKR